MRLYKESELTTLKNELSTVLSAWCVTWFSPDNKLSIELIESCKKRPLQADIAGLHIDVNHAELARLFSGATFNTSPQAERLFDRLWSKALSDLTNRLAGNEEREKELANNSLSNLAKLGSGAIYLECSVDDITLNITLSKELISMVLPKPGYKASGEALTKVADLIKNNRVNLVLNTNSIECDYEKIKALKVGDTLVLSHKVSEPLTVLVNGNQSIAKAFLAKTGQLKSAVVEG
ncbi:MAG: FliM/FliN family flagellar motor C-terminal domain-containing protein [Cycloclasticus sp.]|jgi:Surface presentation of antigens (SPOA).